MDDLLKELKTRIFPGAEFTPLAGGGTNSVFLLRTNGKQSVIKVAMISNKNAETESLCLQWLQGTGLAPSFIQRFQIGNRTAIQMEYVDGRTFLDSILALREEGRMDEIPSVFSTMGKFLAELHQIPVPDHLNKIATIIPENRTIENEWYQRSMDCIANLRENLDPVLLHGDFGYHNIIAGAGGRLTLIDWELAGVGDPRLDIANVLFWTHLHFPDIARKCVHEFLDAYAGERKIDFSPMALHAFVIVQVWRIIELVNEHFPTHVIKEWNRRLSWALDHDFV